MFRRKISRNLTNKSAVWVNKFEHTGSTCHQAGPQALHMQVYLGLSPKKLFQKPNLGEFQMKTVFCSYSVAVVMTHDSRVRENKLYLQILGTFYIL
jgi:hypothetical protein